MIFCHRIWHVTLSIKILKWIDQNCMRTKVIKNLIMIITCGFIIKSNTNVSSAWFYSISITLKYYYLWYCSTRILHVTLPIEILKWFDQNHMRAKVGVHHLLLAIKNIITILICGIIMKTAPGIRDPGSKNSEVRPGTWNRPTF